MHFSICDRQKVKQKDAMSASRKNCPAQFHEKNDQLRQLRLTLLFSLIVFIILVCTALICALCMYILIRIGIVKTHQFGASIIPLLIFCVILGTILAAIFSKTPVAPLKKLMDATDRIAEGDYSVRLCLRGPTEFRQLAAKFNHMAQELGSVEMLRSDFVNNFSHEFKTPIVSIRGFAKALKWDNLTEQERTQYLDIIIEEAERLSELSTSVLNLSRIEQQSSLTDVKRFNVSEQLRLVVTMLAQKWEEKHIDIDFDCDELEVAGNEELLHQAWINILDNAIKFSEDGGLIAIRGRHICGSMYDRDPRASFGKEIDGDPEKTTGEKGESSFKDTYFGERMSKHQELPDGIVLTFTDHGRGMSEEAVRHIFDKFYQESPSRHISGNGLGMSLVKRIIDLHEGIIEVKSKEGEGSQIKIWLPDDLTRFIEL